MGNLNQAVETQLKNIQARTGKTFDELASMLYRSGLIKHAEIREMFQNELGLSYGDANSLVHAILRSDGTRAAQARNLSADDVLAEIYAGPKTALRPIHDRLMADIDKFGEFEVLPKKGYVSLRRKKQFAMIGPATNTRVEVGINAKGLEPAKRLLEQPAGSMCNYKVKIAGAGEVDTELIRWIRQAYEDAG